MWFRGGEMDGGNGRARLFAVWRFESPASRRVDAALTHTPSNWSQLFPYKCAAAGQVAEDTPARPFQIKPRERDCEALKEPKPKV